MKRTRLRSLVAALCLLAPGVALAQELPPEMAKTKTLRVAQNVGYPPLEFRDPKTNEVVGFDIDMVNEIAKELGVKVEWQDGAFENMTPSLQSGRVDMIMSGFYDTPKRRAIFDFIDYLKAGAQFYTLESLKDLKSPADLCGKTITTTRGTSYPDTVKAFSEKTCAGKDPITVIVDTDLGQQLSNLKQDRAVAAVQGLEAVPTIIQMEPGTYRPLGEPISAALMGIAFNKSDTQLRDAVHAALKKVVADGRYDAAIKKWKLDLSAYPKLSINEGPQP